jgi:hypothetical protein
MRHWARNLYHLYHRLVHLLKLRHGHVVSCWWNGWLWIGFQCAKCGEVTNITRRHFAGFNEPNTPWIDKCAAFQPTVGPN